MVRGVWLGLVGLAFFAGLGMGLLWERQAPAPHAGPVCRPSSPAEISGPPAILFWGNSLAFDADWPLDGHQAVNCARQGLTASAALPLLDTLPAITPEAVVLVFGTVELVRGPVDANAFQADLLAIADTLRAKAPDAAIIALGLPSAGQTWSYNTTEADTLTAAMRGIDGVTLLPLDPILAQHAGPISYDGVHLSPSVYPLIRAAVDAQLADGTPRP